MWRQRAQAFHTENSGYKGLEAERPAPFPGNSEEAASLCEVAAESES